MPNINNITNFIIQYHIYIAAGISVVSCLMLIFLNRKQIKEFRNKIRTSKKNKESLVYNLKNTLSDENAIIKKVIDDEKIIGVFSIENIKKAISANQKLESNLGMLSILENNAIQEQISGYFNFVQEALTSIVFHEEKLYNVKRDYEYKVLQKRREFTKFKSRISDEDLILEEKNRYNLELSVLRKDLQIFLNDNENKRDELSAQLTESLAWNINIQNELDLYLEEQVFSKKLYIRHLSYI